MGAPRRCACSSSSSTRRSRRRSRQSHRACDRRRTGFVGIGLRRQRAGSDKGQDAEEIAILPARRRRSTSWRFGADSIDGGAKWHGPTEAHALEKPEGSSSDAEACHQVHVQSAGDARHHGHRVHRCGPFASIMSKGIRRSASREPFEAHIAPVRGFETRSGDSLRVLDRLLHRAEGIDGVRRHRPQLRALDLVFLRINPFVRAQFRESRNLSPSRRGARSRRVRSSGWIVFDAGAALAQAGQHLLRGCSRCW